MAVFFSRPSTMLFFFFFFFFITTPLICSPLPCPVHPAACDPSMDIDYPFYTEDNVPGCNRTYLIQCNASKAMLELKGIHRLFPLKNISYREKTITVEDEKFRTDHPHLACNFTYNFTHPVLHFDGPNYSSIIDNPKYGCKREEEEEDSFAFQRMGYNYSFCRDFSFYYCTESEKDPTDQGVLSPRSCKAHKPLLFEWKLNFSEPEGEGMPFLPAGFSYILELPSDCFNANVCSNIDPGPPKREKGPNKNKNAIIGSPKGEKGPNKKKNAIIGASVGGAGAVALIACGFFFWYKRRKRLQGSGLSNLLTQSTSSKFSSMNDPELAESNYHTHIFSYEELQEATNGFDASGELGNGSFGTVYKGTST